MAKKVFRAFAVYLELDDPDFFIKKHSIVFNPRPERNLNHTNLRTNYYWALGPEAVIGPDAMRLGAHNDWGTMAFLFQDQAGGLEAKHTNGTWIPVTPIPNSIVFNAGIMLEMWSGGHFIGTVRIQFTSIFKTVVVVQYILSIPPP